MASASFNQTQASLSSTSPPTSWDVFLSFRDIDTRYKFTSHLYAALDRQSVRTFNDNGLLSTGGSVSDSSPQPIQNSKIYVVVFSQNYASSIRCLDDLVQIFNCYKTMQRVVIPVFYNIDPSIVRHQTGSFGEAFEKHETRFDADRLAIWHDTLTNVANFPGYQVFKNLSEADIIKKIVDGILLEISPMTLDIAQYPVGLDSRVEDIASLLSSPMEDVIRIGIYGMGGVGKTTLAKAVYNHNYHRFQGSCFLANVREVLETDEGLICLQQQLMNDVLKCKDIIIDSIDQGTELIRARISLTKVLIVIDDLEDPMQLDFLEGPFAPGSLIIITSRNEDILDSLKVEARYKVKGLDGAESHQLFSQHAFGKNTISDTYMELSKDILEWAGGLPLALKVLGSNWHKQTQEERICIDKLIMDSIDDVENKLMISFDALKLVDPMLQDIFLDIACFFIGQTKEKVANIMETCYSFFNHCIDILEKRCLLTINSRDELGMHDLLRDMGRKIARNNSPDDPGKQSRLWVSKDISDVLKNHKGTESIEGIIPHNLYCQKELQGVSFSTKAFERMSKLRFLCLKNVNLTGIFERTFEDLRFLCWECCPLKCLPFELYPQKLVTLSLPRSRLKILWDVNMVTKVFENLKTLNMSDSEDLITISNFTELPCLESLNLEGCKSLEEIHISIGSLKRLVSFNLRGCVNLRSLPDSMCNLRALKSLTIAGCSGLTVLPVELGNIGSLIELNAESLCVQKLPASIRRLSKLVELNLRFNKKLKILSDTIFSLKSLEILNIGYCSGLKELPTELGNLESLKDLNMESLSVSKLPDLIGRLSKLVQLKLGQNRNIQTLPRTICHLKALESLSISGCSSMEAVPIELGYIECLKELNMERLSVSKLPDSIGRLSKLVALRLSYNKNLTTLPNTICNLRTLEVLHIKYCSSLEALPIELGNIESLKELNAEGLIVCKLPDSIGRLSKLVELRLRYNNRLKNLPDTICNLGTLEVLDIGYCILEALPIELGNIESLKELNAQGLTISRMPDSITLLSKLVTLRFSSKNLETLPDTIFSLRSLEILDISGCGKLKIPPAALWKFTRLRELTAGFGTQLQILPDIKSSMIAISLKSLNLSGSDITSLTSGISQLTNLEMLDLRNCRHLLFTAELPLNLKRILANGCTSLKSILDLSGLKQLEILDLTNCSDLREIVGLEELFSIRSLCLGGCNSSLLAYTFTKHFFQIYSEFGHQIKICTSAADLIWVNQSSNLGSAAGLIWANQSSNLGSAVSVDIKLKKSKTEDKAKSVDHRYYGVLQPNVSHNSLATILCFTTLESSSLYRLNCTVKTTTNYFNGIHGRPCMYCKPESVMVILPRSIFFVGEDNRTIELNVTNAKVLGIHLLYKTESTMINV